MTIVLGAAAVYFPGDVLPPRSKVFFVYVWVSSPEEVSRLVRLVDLEKTRVPRPEGASVRLQIQQWSDYSADGDLPQTEAALSYDGPFAFYEYNTRLQFTGTLRS